MMITTHLFYLLATAEPTAAAQEIVGSQLTGWQAFLIQIIGVGGGAAFIAVIFTGIHNILNGKAKAKQQEEAAKGLALTRAEQKLTELENEKAEAQTATFSARTKALIMRQKLDQHIDDWREVAVDSGVHRSRFPKYPDDLPDITC